MDVDRITMGVDDWQHRLSNIAREIEGIADEEGYDALLAIMDRVLDAIAACNEARP